MVSLFAQALERTGTLFNEVGLAQPDDQRAPLALDQVGDAQILFLERPFRIHQQDHHLGEANGIERVGNGQLFELLLDPGPAPHPCGIVHAEALAVPGQFDRDRIAGDAGLRTGQQPLLAEQAVDQRRLPGIGATDHGDADRAGWPRLPRRSLSSSAGSASFAGTVASGSAARSAS